MSYPGNIEERTGFQLPLEFTLRFHYHASIRNMYQDYDCSFSLIQYEYTP